MVVQKYEPISDAEPTRHRKYCGSKYECIYEEFSFVKNNQMNCVQGLIHFVGELYELAINTCVQYT